MKPKTRKIRGNPQIPQISQMTATKEFGFIRRKHAFGTKCTWQRPSSVSPLICGIYGFKFGI
jgi:hypothetical protein